MRNCKLLILLVAIFLGFKFLSAEIFTVHSSDTEVTVESSFDDPLIQEVGFDQNKNPYHEIKLPGLYSLFTDVGSPNLPQIEILIGVPQTGNIELSTKSSNFKSFDNINIIPVPKVSWDSSKLEKSSVYQENRFFPGPVAEIKEIGFLRNIRVAKILISPVQYNPVTKHLEIHQNLNITARFSAKPTINTKVENENIGYFDRIYEKMLLNGRIAKNWKMESAKRIEKTLNKGYLPQPTMLRPRDFFEISDNWLKVKIETTGVYKINYQDLNNLGINPNTINPKTFRLFNIGNYITNIQYPDTMIEIPIYVYGETDNSFDQQDYILFWGEGVSGWDSTYQNFQLNLFTNYNYYWLSYGDEIGLRIGSIPTSSGINPLIVESARRLIHFEQDLLCPARSGLLWLWQYITKAAEKPDTSLEIAFELPNVDSLIQIRLAVQQPSTNPTNFKIYLNQVLIGARQVGRSNPTSPHIIALDTLPPVSSESNVIRIQLTGSTEMQLYIDYFDVEYRQKLNLSRYKLEFSLEPGETQINLKGVRQTPFIFDVTEKFKPKWVNYFTLNGDSLNFQVYNPPEAGQSYYHITDWAKLLKPISIEKRQPGKLKTETNPAHYYIITPDELYEESRLLELYRNNNIVGIPQARVKSVKLSDLYDEYSFGIEEPGAIRRFFKSNQPIYGLLLGDGTYDYRNNLGFTDFPPVPAYETGYDFSPDVYAQTAVAKDAYYAQFDTGPLDMILARVTCRNPQEVRQFYNKVKEYESGTSGFWNSRLLLLADDEWVGFEDPDDGMIWTHIVDCESMDNLFKDRLEPVKIYLTEYPYAPGNEYAKPLARSSFIKALNQGALLLSYFGHGAGWQLAHEKAFYVEEDVVKVNNDRRNPFAFFGSCGVGRFEDTRFQSIAEELVRIPDGAIGTVGATKATTCGTNLLFATEMFGFINDSIPSTIGQAFFTTWYRDDKYHLFGDPALVLNLPEKKQSLQINPDTFNLGEVCTISDSIPFYPANYYLTAYGPQWRRTYQSYFYGRINTINYILPGFELFRGSGLIAEPNIDIPFIIPRGQSPNMRGDGYQELINTSKVYLGVRNGSNYYPLVKDSIPISYDTTPRTDTTGPLVNLYADQQLIRQGSQVPAQFKLSGTISDPSGILILPNTVTGCSLHFFDPTSGTPINLAQYFVYSNNSYTQGQFIYPELIKLLEDLDTLVIIAYDGQLNRTEKKVEVQKVDEALKITNALVYPNPVKQKTHFTFTLTKPAYIRINIYTINGRPVKTIPDRYCPIGYNQVEWDGRDDMGVIPANGVYLYQIKARITEGRNQESSTVITDKLLILR
jgi:hypothetical protein